MRVTKLYRCGSKAVTDSAITRNLALGGDFPALEAPAAVSIRDPGQPHLLNINDATSARTTNTEVPLAGVQIACPICGDEASDRVSELGSR